MPTPAGLDVPGLLAEEAEALRLFVDLLKREQRLLAEGNVDSLVALAEKKSDFAETLGNLSCRREAALAAEGIAGGMGVWLAKPGNQRHEAKWRELLDSARVAKNLNETNGKLIALRLGHNQQALNALLAAADLAMTYGPDGQQRPPGGGRTLGSA